MSLLKLLFSILVVVVISFIAFYSYYTIRNISYTQDHRYSVIMVGRSTTDLWFRYWNLPRYLNMMSVWKNWYIPYQKYVKNGLYFEYLQVPAPHKNINSPGVVYGQEMYDALTRGLTNRQFDALSFKYCFVDFGDGSIKDTVNMQKRYTEMINLVKRVHQYTKSRNMKLLLNNALPVLVPGKYGQEIRLNFNQWVDEYCKENRDVIKIELFENLIDQQGNLKNEFSVDPADSDSHLNMLAFKNIQNEIFDKLNRIIENKID